MVPKRVDDAFMALLRSYHSQRFCRAAVAARNGVAVASPFSTTALRAAAQPRRRPPGAGPQSKSEEAEPIFTKDMQIPKQVAVIGSGITGLTTAHYLAKWLPETSHITIYEATNRVGGWIDTQSVDVDVGGKQGTVRFERGPRTLRGMGKDTWKFDDLVLWDLLRDLDMVDECIGKKSPPRYLYYPDHLVKLGLWSALTEPVLAGLIPGMLTALLRRAKARGGTHPPDMSVSDFVKYATDRPELTDNVVSAMIHGIWGGDADRLSMRSFMPQIWWRFFYKAEGDDAGDRVIIPQNEKGILLTLGEDEELCSYSQRQQQNQLLFFKKGMSSLPNAIARQLRQRPNVTFKLGEPITDVKYNRQLDRVSVSTKKSPSPVLYDKVISTTTSNALSAMTAGALPSLAKSPNVSILAVNMWYPEPFLNAGHRGVGYLVPRSLEDNLEGLLGVFFDSDVVPRGPVEPHGTKFFVLMGGHHWDNRPSPPTEEEGIEMAKDIIERHLGIPKDQPCFAMAKFARDCIPQHHVGHWQRMGRVNSELESAFGGRLAVAGGSYTSIGVVGGIRAAYDMALHTTKSAQEHVGQTGLAQFQHNVPHWFFAHRNPLRRAGRDI